MHCSTLALLLLAAALCMADAWTDVRSRASETARVKAMLDSNDDVSLKAYYSSWAASHGRSYKGEEEGASRFAQFKRGLERVVAINSANQAAGAQWWATPNRWTDRTFEEFAAANLGTQVPPNYKPAAAAGTGAATERPAGRKLLAPPPSSVDWVKQGKVTPVKMQGGCGACWAFSSVAAIESMYLLQHGKQWDLSEQQLIDCVTVAAGYNGHGCSGGWPADVLTYATRGNITTEEQYPYMYATGTCNTELLSRTAPSQVARIRTRTGFKEVKQRSAKALMKAVAKQPIITTFRVEPDFMYYAGGVYSGASCTSTEINHGMLIVGYSTEPGAEPYWLIKNSWGTGWGEGGYARVRMAPDGTYGTCGMYQFNFLTSAVPKPKA